MVEFKLGYDSAKFEFVSGSVCGYLAEMDVKGIEQPTDGEVWITGMGASQVGAEGEVIAILTFRVREDIMDDSAMAAVETPKASTSAEDPCVVTTVNGGVSVLLMLGDLNFDGEIDMLDAYALYRVASGGSELTAKQAKVADMNGDGEYDMLDAYALYRIASGAV